MAAGALRCDHLINAAGGDPSKDILDLTVADWRRASNVNAESFFLLSQAIEPQVPPDSAIVNLPSSSANLATAPEAAECTAPKSAVVSITRPLAYRFAQVPVRVNAACHAVIDTSTQEWVLAEGSALRRLTEEQLSLSRNASFPIGRAGRSEEVAALIGPLCSKESSYITGQAMNIGGGYVTL